MHFYFRQGNVYANRKIIKLLKEFCQVIRKFISFRKEYPPCKKILLKSFQNFYRIRLENSRTDKKILLYTKENFQRYKKIIRFIQPIPSERQNILRIIKGFHGIVFISVWFKYYLSDFVQMFTCLVEKLTGVNEKLDFAIKNDFEFVEFVENLYQVYFFVYK